MIDHDLLSLSVATAAIGLVLARADRGAEDGQGEPNTYGLPEGEPISAELKKWFKLQKEAVLGAIPDSGPLPEEFPDLAGDDWTDPMKTAMTPLVGAYWDESGKEVYARLGLDPGDWRVVNPHLRHQIERQSFAFCKATNQSTSKRIGRALEQMKAAFVAGLVEEGETLPQLAKRVEGIFEGLTKSHAGMIAATEASRAVHAAQLQADVDSEVVAGLELLLSADACPLCRKVATECKRVRLGQSFAVIGEHPEYSHIKFPPIHPRCQCTAIEVLLPEYGGPEKVEWGHTLIQPQKDLKGGYTPPEGKPEPKPEPKKAAEKPRPTKPPPAAKPGPLTREVVLARLEGIQRPSERKKAIHDLLKEHEEPGTITGAFHGMSAAETFRTVTLDGIRYHYPPLTGDMHDVDVMVAQVRILTSGEPIPRAIAGHTRDVYFTGQANKKDSFWRVRYNDPTHVSAATGGDGAVVVYHGKPIDTGLMAHEMGHNWARALYNDASPPASSAFVKAIESGEPAVSAYARNNNSEDFAETVRKFVVDPGPLEADQPLRYRAIKELLDGNADAERRP